MIILTEFYAIKYVMKVCMISILKKITIISQIGNFTLSPSTSVWEISLGKLAALRNSYLDMYLFINCGFHALAICLLLYIYGDVVTQTHQ